jgi:hypothetical protein
VVISRRDGRPGLACDDHYRLGAVTRAERGYDPVHVRLHGGLAELLKGARCTTGEVRLVSAR